MSREIDPRIFMLKNFGAFVKSSDPGQKFEGQQVFECGVRHGAKGLTRTNPSEADKPEKFDVI